MRVLNVRVFYFGTSGKPAYTHEMKRNQTKPNENFVEAAFIKLVWGARSVAQEF